MRRNILVNRQREAFKVYENIHLTKKKNKCTLEKVQGNIAFDWLILVVKNDLMRPQNNNRENDKTHLAT